MKLEKLVIPTVAVIVALVILQAAQPYVEAVTEYPDWLEPIITGIKNFFKVTPIATGLSFAWSLFGFLRYVLGGQTVEFEVKKFAATFAWFEGAMIVLASGFSPAIAAAVTSILMAAKSVLNSLLEKAKA